MGAHYTPVLPTELTINEHAQEQYREWLLERSAKKTAVVVGRAGIGKETMVHVVNRMMNYKEEYVDGTEQKEEVLHRVAEIVQSQRAKNIFGRRVAGVLRDVDASVVYRVCGDVRHRAVPVVVIMEDVPRKVFEMEGAEIIRCYNDAYRVERRVEKIARAERIKVPEEMRERIRAGEKIGKALADLMLWRHSPRMASMGPVENPKATYLEIAQKLLHNKGGLRRGYHEVERLCERNGMDPVYEVLLENYAEKCLTLDDACKLSEKASLYGGCAQIPGMYHLQCVGVYLHHCALYNDLVQSFKVPARTRTTRKRHILCGGQKSKRWERYVEVHSRVECAVDYMEKTSTPSKAPGHVKKYVQQLFQDITLSEIIDQKKIELLSAVNKPEMPGKTETPRYIHKDGYSCYVTRNISLSEIFRR